MAKISPENIRRFDGRAYRRIAAVITRVEADGMKARFKSEGTLVRITEGKYLGKTYYEVWVSTPYIRRSFR